MAMVYASPPPRRARSCDSQADVETRVFVRPTPRAWRNVFLEPWTPSDPPLPWAPVASSHSRAMRAQAPTVDELPAGKVGGRRRRSMMPWVLFMAAFGIACGIGRDRTLRAELGTELRVAAARTLAVLQTTATRLGRQRD